MPHNPYRGFDPARLSVVTRPADLVPRILAREDPASVPVNGFTQIRVVGVGGAGNNAVNRMIDANLLGVEFIAINTDAQALEHSHAHRRLVIGPRTTRHLGAGGDPKLGERAATESADELVRLVTGADMVFVAAGMGGGTGTGAAPAVATLARAEGALTVAVVTLPFRFEGRRRNQVALDGAQVLARCVDAIVMVHNDRLLELTGPRVTFGEAFITADEMLHRGVQGISDLITTTGLVNVDFADVRSIMSAAGTAMMGVGEAAGEERALRAVTEAMRSPLLGTPIDDASGVVLNFTGSSDLTLAELNVAAQAVARVAAPEANIIFGSVIDERMGDAVRVTLIATGFQAEATGAPKVRHGVPSPGQPRAARPGARRAPPVVRELTLDDEPGDSLQIPTFLRRRRQS